MAVVSWPWIVVAAAGGVAIGFVAFWVWLSGWQGGAD